MCDNDGGAGLARLHGQRAFNGSVPEPIRGDRGASILGPRNVPIETKNPDLLVSPSQVTPAVAASRPLGRFFAGCSEGCLMPRSP